MEDKWRAVAVTAVAPVAWGSTYFVTREFLPDLPLWGATLRALPAGLLLLAIRPRHPRGQWWWRAPVLGVLNMAAFFALVYAAAQLLPTSVASTIMAASPVGLMLVAWLLLSTRPSVASLVAAGLGIGGVVLLVGRATEPIDPLGVAASISALALSSVGSVLTKRWNDGTDLLASTAWQLIAGGVLLLPLAALVEGPPPEIDAPASAAYAYVAVVATALAFVAWFAGLRRLDTATVGLIGLLNPVTGVALGTLAASERLLPQQWLGLALVLSGVLAGVLSGGRPSPPARTAGVGTASCARGTLR